MVSTFVRLLSQSEWITGTGSPHEQGISRREVMMYTGRKKTVMMSLGEPMNGRLLKPSRPGDQFFFPAGKFTEVH